MPDPVKATGTTAERAPVLAGTVIRLTDAKTIEGLPLADLGADLVIDGTGVFKTGAKVAPYDAAGVKKVVVKALVKDGRALILNTTGSASAIPLISPKLDGRLNGQAAQVPLLNASLTDGAFAVERATTVKEVDAWLMIAADGPLKRIRG